MKSYEPSHDFDTHCVLHAKFVFTIESREREREARVKKVSEFDEISMDVYFSYIFERGKKSIVDVGGETMRKR